MLLLACITATVATAEDGLARARRWRTRGCEHAYADAAGACFESRSPSEDLEEACDSRALPRRLVRESLCRPAGRANATTPAHAAQEVVLVPELRVAWVVNRKAASSSVRAALTRHFNAYWTKCASSPSIPRNIRTGVVAQAATASTSATAASSTAAVRARV